MSDAVSPKAETISAVVLAAGLARRMGRDKLMLTLGDQPVIRHVIEEVLSVRFFETIVVVNPNNNDAIRKTLADLPVRIVHNEHFQDGMASSIVAGVTAVDSASVGVMLAQGDQPLVNAEIFRSLIGAWDGNHLEFVAASFDGVVTTPVLFGCVLLPELKSLSGDVGARSVLKRHDGRVIEFEGWRGSDVDTDEDYAKVKRIFTEVRSKRLAASDRGEKEK
jgi:molybdenum cofactor cytidylyltransferase